MKIKLRNRLEVLMKDSGIQTFEEMAQRLTAHQDVKITRTALSRKFRDDDVTLSLQMTQAICNELQCLPGDFFETDVTEASEEFVDGLRSRLQPFRYGSIRLQKAAGEAEKTASSDEAPMPRSPTPKARRAAPKLAEDFDAIAGPRVSHLHVGKLNHKG